MLDNSSEDIMPVRSWLTAKDAYIGLLLCSFIINVLGLVFPICVLHFYDRIIPHKSIGTLVAMICLILCAFALEATMKILRSYVSSWASERFTFNMGKKLFHRLLYSDLADFEKNSAGEYLDRFNSAESLREYYCGQNLTMLVDLPFVSVYIILMFVINRNMGIMPTIVVLLMFLTSSIFNAKTLKQLKLKKDITEAKSKFLIEMISGIHTIKALAMEEQFMRRYERLHQTEIYSNYELIQRLSQSSRSAGFYSQLGVVLTAAQGGLMVMHHSLSVGGMAACILLVGKIMQPVASLISFMERKQNIIIAKNNYEFIMSFKPEYKEKLDTLDDFQGGVEIRNLSFKYSGSDNYIFKGLNLKVAPRETIVIHGDGFSGKTTIMYLICSLYKPKEGDIFFDGVNVNDVDLERLRRQIAFMPSDGELFDGTIMDNLTLFQKEEYSHEAIEICKSIGLHQTIENMPNSYNTEVGNGTVDLLSKGHKQQVLIVRALVGSPKIILFDEANVALDIDSDVQLRKYFLSIKGNATMILVTHRPSLLEMADKHYRLIDGKLEAFEWKM
jgi:ATP-binding cassette subfamily C protein LapB